MLHSRPLLLPTHTCDLLCHALWLFPFALFLCALFLWAVSIPVPLWTSRGSEKLA